jgi:hypothetical protein
MIYKLTPEFITLILYASLFLLPSFAQARPTKNSEMGFTEVPLFSIDLIRHGDRVPITEIPKAPHEWGVPMGSLTQVGIEQELRLGKVLRKEYIERYALLPTHFSPETLYVRSTDLKRTQASAKALLQGLYPDEGATIPIDVVPRAKDTLLMVKPSENPISIANRYFKERAYWREKTKGLERQLLKWGELTGVTLDNFKHLNDLTDNLYIRRLHQIAMPPGLDEKAVDALLSLEEDLFVHLFQMPEVTAENGSHFIREVLRYFRNAQLPGSKLKSVLFIAHDSTLLSVLNALEVKAEHIPGYAARLNLLLLRNKKGSEPTDLQIRVLYDDKPVFIPRCNGNTCALAQFFNEL